MAEAAGYEILGHSDIKTLPLNRISEIFQAPQTVIELAEDLTQAENGGVHHQTLTLAKPLLKATRGIIPHIKWRTQEKRSALGHVLASGATKLSNPDQRRQQAHRGVQGPWTATNNLNVPAYRFGDVRDMDADIQGVEAAKRRAARPGVPAATQKGQGARVDLNSQAQLGGASEAAAQAPQSPGAKDASKPKTSESLQANVAAIRGYLELLDQYSLHHFIIYKGKTVFETPEFESFQRLYVTRWGAIMSTISALERLLKKHNVPVAVIDGPRVADLAVLEQLQIEELLRCVANLDQIQPLLVLQRSSVDKKLKRKARAAIKIQAIIRGYLGRRRVFHMQVMEKAAIVIQSAMRTYTSMVKTKRLLRKKRQGDLARWKELVDDLRDRVWPAVQTGKEHVILHIPSLSIEEHLRLSLPDFLQRESQQLGRVFDAVTGAARHATVVYVSPLPLPDEIFEYMVRKLFERHGVSPRRLHVLIPENADRFPGHFPLASLVLYSPRCIRRIRSLVKGKPAYIMPGPACNWQDRKLAELLRLPLLGPDPGVVQEYSAKSGIKRAFMEANVNVPLGAHDIYDEETLILSLTKLIAANLAVERWIIKLDVDYENLSWAFLDVRHLDCIVALRKEKEKFEEINQPLRGDTTVGDPSITIGASATLASTTSTTAAGGPTASVWHHQDVQLLARSKILKDLRSPQFLERRVTMCCPHVYPRWATFLAYLGRYGAVIEAEPKNVQGYPSVSLLIAPDGKASMLATYDMVYETGTTYSRLGSTYPCSSVPHRALEGACMSIAKQFYARSSIIGHVTVNFVVFKNRAKGGLRLWALDAKMGMDNPVSTLSLFQLLVSVGDQEGDAQAGNVTNTCYTILDDIAHPSLGTVSLPSFFKACRLESIAYNLDSHRGLVFLFFDSLVAGTVGVMGLGRSAVESLTHTLNALDFLKRQLGGKTLNQSDSGRAFLRAVAVLTTYREKLFNSSGRMPRLREGPS
jgi:IQ domain-containing protein H